MSFIKHFTCFTVLLIVASLASGCSGGDMDAITLPPNPAVPEDSMNSPDVMREPVSGEDESNRILWGVWLIDYTLDEFTISAVPAREIQAHFNITDHLLPPECTNCFEINVVSFDPVKRI